MTKRHCYVQDVGIAIEKLADALDPQRTKPFSGDILDLLEWAERDALEMNQQVAERNAELKRINHAINDVRVDLTITASEAITELRQQLAAAQDDASTAWAQAHRLALELECLIMDTKDNATVSKWWDSAHEAMDEYHKLKPGAAEDAEAWAKIRKAGI